MNKVQVIINGKKIYERKTPRTYSHAVVAVRFQTMTCDRSGERPVYTMAPVEPTLVISCHRTELLAQKAAREAGEEGGEPVPGLQGCRLPAVPWAAHLRRDDQGDAPELQ